MVYEISIKVEGFEGTIELMVLKVRSHEVDIIDVRLSNVARQAADAVLADPDRATFEPFLHLARLMWLKSRSLLPGSDIIEDTELAELELEAVAPEEEPTEVRERLRELYQVFRFAGEMFREKERENQLRIRPSETRAGVEPEFFNEIDFIDEVTPFDLMVVMNQVLRAALRGRTLRVEVDAAKVLAQRIADVFDFVFARRGLVSFAEMISDARENVDIVLTFLAVVYLVAQGRFAARQKNPYGEIIVNIREAESSES